MSNKVPQIIIDDLEGDGLLAIARVCARYQEPPIVYHYVADRESPDLTASKKRIFKLLFPQIELKSVSEFVAPDCIYSVLQLSPVPKNVVDAFKKNPPLAFTMYTGEYNTGKSDPSFEEFLKANPSFNPHIVSAYTCSDGYPRDAFDFDVFGKFADAMREFQAEFNSTHLETNKRFLVNDKITPEEHDEASRILDEIRARVAGDLPLFSMPVNARVLKYLGAYSEDPDVKKVLLAAGKKASMSKFALLPCDAIAAASMVGDLSVTKYGKLVFGRYWGVECLTSDDATDTFVSATCPVYSSDDLRVTRQAIIGYFERM